MSILDLDWSLRSQVINGMTNQELHDLMVMEYGSTVNFANSVLLNDPCYDVMSLSILSSSYYNFAAALLNQANPMELQALWDFYFFPTAFPWDMNQVADEFFNTFDLDIYNKILALDGVKDNFFMTYELHFGFGSLETYLVGYSDFKLCTRNALTDAGLIGIYNMHDQIGLWDAMNAFYPWHALADKMLQHNPDAFLFAGLPYLPQYVTNLLESGIFVEVEPDLWQPLYKISLEQFFDSIRTYPGLGEAYMLQLTNQLIALGYASPGWSYAVGEHHIYGSSRLGIHQTKKELRNRYKQEEIFIPSNTVNTAFLYRGKRNYELSNHLGNVQMVISDKRKSVCDEELGVEYFVAEVLSAVDYYPFGSIIPDRQWYANSDSSAYRFGFQNQEKDDEIKGKGNSVNFRYRMHDPRLGRFFSVDPLFRQYPYNSSYAFSENDVIRAIELEGLEKVILFGGADASGGGGTGTAGDIAIDVTTQAIANKYNNTKVVLINSNYNNPIGVIQEAVKSVMDNYNPNEPIIIYGYSKGGDYALMLARELQNKRVEVTLLITIDAADGPFSSTIDRTIPGNVVEHVNYYQTQSSPIFSRGGPATAEDKGKTSILNANLTGMTADTEEGKNQKIKHSNIDEVTREQSVKLIVDTIEDCGTCK